MSAKKRKTPQPTAADGAHAVARIALGSLPLVGALATELFNSVIAPPLARRRDEFLERIATDLQELQERVDDWSVDKLADNPEFVSAVVHAMRAALATHQEEKLEALRNAVLNVAAGTTLEEDLQLMFLNFVDTLTPSHLRFLRKYSHRDVYGKQTSVKRRELGFSKYGDRVPANPELRQKREFNDQLFRDLHGRGLFSTYKSQDVWTGVKLTTDLGDRFLDFITSPLEG